MKNKKKPSIKQGKQGLSKAEVKRLQLHYGFNELPIKDPKSLVKTLVKIITEPMFSLLLLAGTVYLIIGSIEDALLLLCFIALSIGITAYQEHKSERAIEALKDLSSPRALVIREGQTERIAGREIVTGNLLKERESSLNMLKKSTLYEHSSKYRDFYWSFAPKQLLTR